MRTFEYHLVPVADWLSHLEQFVSHPGKCFSVHLLWGEHEKIKGVRDFHSKPRLKIEKIFSLAQSLGLSIDITFGFTSDSKSFPDWVWGLDSKSQVPLFNETKLSRWRFHEIPSVRSDEVRSGFLAFFEEALAIIKLHAQPGGSVRSVTFNWGILGGECPVVNPLQINHRLQNRYTTPQKLNLLFQSHFRDFETASSPMGFKTLFKKRPWLICWDYQALRQEALDLWVAPIQEKLRESGLESMEKTTSRWETHSSYLTLLDDTLVHFHQESSSLVPVLFQGELDPLLVRVFQLAEAIQEKAKESSEKIEPLSKWTPSEAVRQCTIFCQGFLARDVFKKVQEFLIQGGRVFFPFGLPKWDELMETLPWEPEHLKGEKPAILVGKEIPEGRNSLGALYQNAKQVFL